MRGIWTRIICLTCKRSRKRIAFHERCLKELEESGKSTLTITDPECAMMPARAGGVKVCYNVQTAVDASSHMIAGFHVTSNSNDRGQPCRTMGMCKEELGLQTVHVIADKGYESAEDIKNCLMNGVIRFIYTREERVFLLDYVDLEITPDMKASSEPEDIQACLHAGVLPDCYEGTNISIQLQSLGQVSGFIRHDDGRATCPMGRELFRQRATKYGIRSRIFQP